MLFSNEIVDMVDDSFEGSTNECQVFREVFFGKVDKSNRHLVTEVINIECNKSKNTLMPVCANSENSAVTSHEELYYIQGNVRSFQPGCTSEDTILMRNEQDVHLKRVKLSVENISSDKSYTGKALKYPVASKEVISHGCQTYSDSSCENMDFYLVESSSKGLTCCCYLLGHHGETDNVSVEYKLSDKSMSKKKEAVSSKAIASPISQESYATKLLAASSSVAADFKSESARCPKPKWKDSSFVEENICKMPQVTNDPRPLLRYYIHCLLRAAGWVVGRRKRSNKFHGIGEYVFKSPEGRPIREFRRAWNLCGEKLFKNRNNVMQETDGKQWADMKQFWSDLCHTLTEFEEHLSNTGNITALAHCWCLLDPFARVVFIEKTVNSLKSGRIVKTRKSLVIDSYVEKEGGMLSEFQFLLDYSGEAGTMYEEISGNEKGQFNPCSLAAHGSESTCDQISSYPFEAPIGSGNLNMSVGFSEIVSPQQESSTNSPCCVKVRPDHDKMPLAVMKSTCISSYRGEGKIFERKDTEKLKDLLQKPMDNNPSHNNGHEIDTFSKRKTQKKLKRISDIELTSLHCNGNLGLATFYDVQSHDVNVGSVQFESEVQDCFVSNVGNYECCKNSSFCPTPLLKKKNQNKFKKVLSSGSARNDPKDQFFFNNVDKEVAVSHGKVGQKKSHARQLKDDDLLISALINNQSSRYAPKSFSAKRTSCKSNALRKLKSQKGTCRLLPRSLNKGGKHLMEGNWFAFGLRTVLFWMVNSGVISFNEVIQYRNLKDDTVVKDGIVTKEGILCRCCTKMFSVSEFKMHAGFKLNRPCLNLFMESGKPFTLCQLEAWSAEYKTRKSSNRTVQVDEMDQNDDSCGLCGDGGELLCCDNCPSTFHQTCLLAEEELPEGNWYCRHCTCQVCEDVVNAKEALKSHGALECLQCNHKYHEACLTEKFIGVISDMWFCSQSCQEVHSGLTSRIGSMNLLSDGFSWALLRAHGDQKVHSAQRFIAMKAECNSKLAVALTIMEECFLPMVDPRTGIDMIPHVLYNWGSQFARLNYSGFYTVILEKDDVLMSVASLRIHGVRVAEVPLIATCSKYRRQGMCRRLMNSIEEMLKAFKVEMLLISAIPSLVETWTVGFGFKPLEDSDKRSLSKINLMVFPGAIWLKKSLFKNQTQDQLMGLPLTEDYAETAPFSEESAVKVPANLSKVDNVIENIPDDCNSLCPVENINAGLPENFSTPSFCEESASASKDPKFSVICHTESLELHDKRRPFFVEHWDKTCDSKFKE